MAVAPKHVSVYVSIFRLLLATAWQAISRDANTGAGQDFTDLAAAVQLRLRVAIGLQTLTVKLRLLPGRNTVQVRGSPPAFAICTAGGEGCRAEAQQCVGGLLPPVRLRLGRPFHAGVAQQRQQQFRKLPGNPPHESASLRRPIFMLL